MTIDTTAGSASSMEEDAAGGLDASRVTGSDITCACGLVLPRLGDAPVIVGRHVVTAVDLGGGRHMHEIKFRG